MGPSHSSMWSPNRRFHNCAVFCAVPGCGALELLQALRADLRSLLDAEAVPDVDEPIGKRFKLELDTKDWSAPGEAAPSEARAAMRRRLDELRVELEEAVGRPLLLDALGSQVKYTASKPGEPVSARPRSNTRARVLDPKK